jgi:hypothetical protein
MRLPDLSGFCASRARCRVDGSNDVLDHTAFELVTWAIQLSLTRLFHAAPDAGSRFLPMGGRGVGGVFDQFDVWAERGEAVA